MEIPKEASLQVVRRIADPAAPPTPIQHFLYTMVGHDILLEAGYFDLVQLRTAMESSQQNNAPIPVDLYVRHRLVFNPNVILQLAQATGEIIKSLAQSGLITMTQAGEGQGNVYTGIHTASDGD